MNSDSTASIPNLLIVDDCPNSLELLASVLQDKGYRVQVVPSGERALEAALRQPPDLILLDILMPNLDGYEVCARLKTDVQLRRVPVIFISALDGAIDKVKAFAAGGVDYVAKPFQFEEVEARIRTHLALHRQERQLEQNLLRLQQLEHQRDNLVHMIVHDLRSPVCGIAMTLELLQASPKPGLAMAAELLRTAAGSVDLLKAMITQLLDISRLEAGQMPLQKAEHNLVQTLRTSLASCTRLVGQRWVDLHAPAACLASYDDAIIGRVASNLLSNASKFTRPDGAIRLTVERQAELVKVAVTDSGPGIAAQYHQKIFEKFAQVELRQERLGSGLGLAFCKLAVEAHGGQIGVESEPGHGSTFWFTLPVGEACRQKDLPL
jgi:signal transduction histidine kinase